jgi:hypothetical protein
MADEATGKPSSNDKSTAQLEALRKRLKNTKAQIAAIEAKNQQQARKEDTRLKVLIGAAFLADLEHHEETRDLIKPILERAITAPRDRDFLKQKGWL